MKLTSVQYLRAIAALGVVAFHAWQSLLGGSSDLQIARFGEFGVDLFFVISGFIITVSTRNETSALYFIAKRAARIIPLYWLITTIYLAVGLVAPSVLKSTSIRADHVISSFLFIPTYHPIFSERIWPLVIPGWSLNYEWFFYLVFAFAIALAPRRRAAIAIGVLIALTGLGLCVPSLNPIARTYTSTLLIEFIFGIIVGEAFLANDLRALSVAFSLFLMFGTVSFVAELSGKDIWQSAVYGPPSAALLSALLWLERRDYRFASRVAIALGDSSYSIYLTHVVVIAVLRVVSFRSGIQEFGGYLDVVLLVLVLCICGFLGWVNFVLVERPMTAWLNLQLNARRHLANSASQIPKQY